MFLSLVLGVCNFFRLDPTTVSSAQTVVPQIFNSFVIHNMSDSSGLFRSLTRRIILHIDMDAFYAQVEHRRTGIPRDEPLAVQQWEGLIAVNYAARARGISRHMNVHEAKKACPELHCVHVEVISGGGKGEGVSSAKGYEQVDKLGQAAAGMRSDGKVSLGRYRSASAEVFAALQPFGTVEKASIDEAYLDVTQEVEKLYRQVKSSGKLDDSNSEDDGGDSRDSSVSMLSCGSKDVTALAKGELSLEATGSNVYGELDAASVDGIKLLLGG